MDAKRTLIATTAAAAICGWSGSGLAEDMRAGDNYLVDLAIAGMPIELTNAQELIADARQPVESDFNTPGQSYLNQLADTGWQPLNGDPDSTAVVDGFTTPGLGYQYQLDLAGWVVPGVWAPADLTTPGERYIETLAEAGWEVPVELQPSLQFAFYKIPAYN